MYVCARMQNMRGGAAAGKQRVDIRRHTHQARCAAYGRTSTGHSERRSRCAKRRSNHASAAAGLSTAVTYGWRDDTRTNLPNAARGVMRLIENNIYHAQFEQRYPRHTAARDDGNHAASCSQRQAAYPPMRHAPASYCRYCVRVRQNGNGPVMRQAVWR